MYIQRDISDTLTQLSRTFPAVLVTGPRQSGKTTLVQHHFPDHTYVNLENLDVRQQAIDDPRSFLVEYADQGDVIIDEFQRAPQLSSYIQTYIDEHKNMGQFILTGSHNFLIREQVSQSLAGRSAILELLPLSYSELQSNTLAKNVLEEQLYASCYPVIYERGVDQKSWLQSYLVNYIERDVRLIENIKNLSKFQSFVELCATRNGLLVNKSSLANALGLSHATIENWLTILEASYIIFRLKPYHKNLGKRIVKQQKLYFYDTGLLCLLLGISNAVQLRKHPLKGEIFEAWVISELRKQQMNKGQMLRDMFYRDSNQVEVDYMVQYKEKMHLIEIKSASTISKNFMVNLDRVSQLLQQHDQTAVQHIIYNGDRTTKQCNSTFHGWVSIGSILDTNS